MKNVLMRIPHRSIARCACRSRCTHLTDQYRLGVQIKAQLQTARGQGPRSHGVAGVVGQVVSVPMQVVGGTVGLVQQGLHSLANVAKPGGD